MYAHRMSRKINDDAILDNNLELFLLDTNIKVATSCLSYLWKLHLKFQFEEGVRKRMYQHQVLFFLCFSLLFFSFFFSSFLSGE